MNRTEPRWPATALIVAGALARLVPHPPNFTPVSGLSIFAGARIPGWQAYLVPLVIMTITSPIMASMYGFRAFGDHTIGVYLSLLVSVWIGRRVVTRATALRVGSAAVLASLQFYLITNFVWFTGGMYPFTLEGISASYIAALPFLGRTMLSDLLYTGLFFGVHELLTRAARRHAHATA